MKIQKKYIFKNWGRNIEHITANYAQPETEQELISLVKQHQKIRVTGTGHSWSELCKSSELLINLDKYQKVIQFDKENKTVTVQSGIKLWQLNKYLDKVGFALINLGSIADQSLSGAISTGTHGTGIQFQCLASQILSFNIIKADGEKHYFENGTEAYNAAVISLGCLGIISEIKLEITEAYNLHDITYTEDFDSIVNRIDALIQENDHFKLWWMPPAKEMVVYTYKRTKEKRNDTAFRQFMNDRVISVLGYRTLVKVGNIKNNWRPAINSFLTKQLKGPLNRIEKSYKVFNVPEPPKHRETEWAFDIKNVKELLMDYKKLFNDSNFTFNFIQEIRFTKSDDFWLSECYQRDTIWIGAYNHMDKQWDAILPYFEDFAKRWNGRPHWGKEFLCRKKYLVTQYPKYLDFIAMKNELDPSGKFSNDLTDDLFEN